MLNKINVPSNNEKHQGKKKKKYERNHSTNLETIVENDFWFSKIEKSFIT